MWQHRGQCVRTLIRQVISIEAASDSEANVASAAAELTRGAQKTQHRQQSMKSWMRKGRCWGCKYLRSVRSCANLGSIWHSAMHFSSPPLQSSRLCHVGEAVHGRLRTLCMLGDDERTERWRAVVHTHIIPKPSHARGPHFGCQAGSPLPALSPYATRTKFSAGLLQTSCSISSTKASEKV
jgi:hypothetical protein